MAPLKPPSIFKHKALFGFQLPIFPFNFFPPNFVLFESSHAPFSITNPNITSLCNVVVTSYHSHFNIINSNVASSSNVVVVKIIANLKHDPKLLKSTMKKQKYEFDREIQDI
jgi:hypothetical protein